ncbi:MAG TPA: nuclear transport factor 2 family protein, partial [Kofleriaceae bacterium]|nr:nuclear transport factor 2 family protein [Kofleriaceae bacterium]
RMRHGVAFVIALVLAGCPRGSEGTTPRRPATPKEVVASARATIEQWRQAYEIRSFDALAKLYAHDIDLVVVQEGMPLVGWSSVERMLKDRIARYKEVHVRLKDIQVQSLAPTAAVATAAMTRELGDGITTVSESGALTIVLRQEGDAWLIVTEHYSFKRGG